MRLAQLLSVLSLLGLPAATMAFVPPRPGSDLEKTFENVYQYRKRLGIEYQYSPTLLSAELCRYLTEEQCEKADVSLQEHARAHQKTQKALYQQRRRRMEEEGLLEDFQKQLGAFTRTYGNPHKQPTLEEEMRELAQLLLEFNTTKEEHYRERRRLQQDGPSDRSTANHNPSVGTFVVPLFLMKFTDHASRPVPEKYNYQILWNLRIKKWIDENSYGKYDAFFDVQDWENTDNTEAHYSGGVSGRTADFAKSLIPPLESMDKRLGGDWSLYDADGDGFLDNVIVVHSGYAAEEGDVDCTNGRGPEQRIWSHAFSDSDFWTSTNGQYSVRGYNIASGLDLICDANPGKMGVMTHEYMHTFYLIDLYDLQGKGKGVGNFDIMAYPYGMGNDGYIPVSFSPWARETIEWQSCEVITASGEYTMEPAVFSDNCYKIMLLETTQWPEYILLENRQQAGFDIEFWEAGIVMYHIDEGASDQMWAGYPGIPDWPETGDHYRVAVIQADQRYDLEESANNGEGSDIWKPGQTLGPNTDGNTYPNTDSYQQGFIEPTGITIEVLEGEGMNVKFKVTFPTKSGGAPSKRPPNFSAPQKEPIEPMAIEQFIDPHSNFTISGKIPQLPWYQEWRDSQKVKESTTIFTAEQGLGGAASAGSHRYRCTGMLLAFGTTILASVAALW